MRINALHFAPSGCSHFFSTGESATCRNKGNQHYLSLLVPLRLDGLQLITNELKMNFVLLDLTSQATAVQNYVRGWEPSLIIEWLKTKGIIERVAHPYANDIYGFESSIGIRTGFRILHNGQLVIIDNHTTFLP